MNHDNPKLAARAEGIQAFAVKKALVGIEMGSTDAIVLKYFDYFTQQIPVAAAVFMHVLPKYAAIDALFEKETQRLLGDYTIEDDIETRLSEEVRKKLKNYNDIYVEYRLTQGNPLGKMLDTALEVNSDLLVIGQRSDMNFHGILAKNLARKTKSNALIIPDQAQISLSTLLVPIDFSPNSIRALQTAIAINRQLKEKANIICLHIYEMPDINMYHISRNYEQYEAMIKAHISDAMKDFLSTYGPEDEQYLKPVLLKKDLPGFGNYIINYAEDHKVDFIVMGSRGHTKVHLLLMGSTTEKVLSLNKSIPTLVVK